MKKEDFENDLERLAIGHRYEMTAEKARAYWEKFGHYEHRIWKEVVTHALLAPRFPSEDQMYAICDRVVEDFRRQDNASLDRDAKHFMGGHTRLLNRNPDDQAYGEFRFKALIMALKSGDKFAETVLNFLWGWLEAPKNQDYARRTGILDSILGEIDYYEKKAAGENDAYIPQPTANTTVEVEILEDAL